MKIDQIEQTVAELALQIAGSKVAKIHQPAAEVLILRLWNGRENLKLLISVAAHANQVGLTELVLPNPFTPPRFCQLLRARLSRIVQVAQLNDDRIVELTCQGPKGECRLIIELFGKGGNLVLVDADGRIIDVLKRQREGRLAIKAAYRFPEKSGIDHGGLGLAAVTNIGGVVDEMPGNSAQISDSAGTLEGRLRKLLKKEQKKLEKRVSHILQEQARQQDFDHFRIQGELLLANLKFLKRGMNEVVVVDYYRQPTVEVVIPLDPLLSPQGNVEKKFQKYKKARRGLEHSARRLKETAQELEWVEQLVYQLESAQDATAVSEVADELKRGGLLKESSAKLPRVQKGGSAFKEAQSPSGFKVLWGTSSKQNDALSTKILKRGDLWFHAFRCPGAHVVLKSDSGIGPFSDEDRCFAASVAAANSKAAEAAKVEVMIAEAKDVKKPSGAKAGMVTVARYKTLMVQPLSKKDEVF